MKVWQSAISRQHFIGMDYNTFFFSVHWQGCLIVCWWETELMHARAFWWLPDPETKPQHDFNMALSQTRLKIDMTFAILKARFNCLCDLRVSPERASQIVGACVILHNIATIRKERVPNEYQLPPHEIDPSTQDHPTGRGVRDAITAEYFT